MQNAANIFGKGVLHTGTKSFQLHTFLTSQHK